MVMAQIENGVVANIFEIIPGQEGEFPEAVCIDGRPTGIGDTYTDGKFYHNGVECKTDSEMLAELLAQPDGAEEAMAIIKGEEVTGNAADGQ